MTAQIKPTIIIHSKDGDETLAVWPALPGVTDNPCIQIDRPRKQSYSVEYTPEEAHKLAAAIIKATKGGE